MIMLFRTKTIADTWLNEIACMPSGVWVWMGKPVKPSDDAFVECVGDPDGTPNAITYCEDATGRCAIEHGFTDEDIAFVKDYCSAPIKSGDLQLLDKLPSDWVAKSDA